MQDISLIFTNANQLYIFHFFIHFQEYDNM